MSTSTPFKRGISVVIPNFNGVNLLQDNLPTLIDALAATNLPNRIIVIDDCSTDNSINFLRSNYPDVLVVKTEKNMGFSRACNLGIEYCQYDLCCIANTDATFDKRYFEKALPYFVDQNLFAVKGEIQNYQGNKANIINIERTSQVYYSRGFLRFNQKVEPQSTCLTGKLNEQFVLLGCCFVCKTAKIKKLQGYDVRYSPYYWEDADLAFRALEQGYNLVYAPECKIQHNLSSTISRTQSKTKRRVISIRNKFLFTWRHMPDRKYWAYHVFVVLISILIRWLKLDWKYYYCLLLAIRQNIIYRDQNNSVDETSNYCRSRS